MPLPIYDTNPASPNLDGYCTSCRCNNDDRCLVRLSNNKFDKNCRANLGPFFGWIYRKTRTHPETSGFIAALLYAALFAVAVTAVLSAVKSLAGNKDNIKKEETFQPRANTPKQKTFVLGNNKTH